MDSTATPRSSGLPRTDRVPILWAFVFGAAFNLLLLTGPIYMLQVYDRVLTSRSVETLVALSVMAALAFVAMGAMDHVRGRLLARAGARFEEAAQTAVLRAALGRAALDAGDRHDATALADLQAIRQFWAAPVAGALCDLPFTPFFLGMIFIFHPWLGWLSLAGGAAMVSLTLLQEAATRRAAQQSATGAAVADRWAEALLAGAPTVAALGMAEGGVTRWQRQRRAVADQSAQAADGAGAFGAAVRSLRIALQTAVLGLGAFLALRGDLSPGAMIAASILLGRALGPVDLAAGQWPLVQRAREGRVRLAALLASAPAASHGKAALARPAGRLTVQDLAVAPPGRGGLALRGISFALAPGQILGVIGPSGAGKSTLARALCGLWPPVTGLITLDGLRLDSLDAAERARLVGYMPQDNSLFPATVAENVARLAPDPDLAAVMRAARQAQVDDAILSLPQGYDTALQASGAPLTGGQARRLVLARAFCGDPAVLILDEPEAHQDAAGLAAIGRALQAARAAGMAVIVIAHRPTTVADCDLILALDQGRMRAFGPRDRVLAEVLARAGPERPAA